MEGLCGKHCVCGSSGALETSIRLEELEETTTVCVGGGLSVSVTHGIEAFFAQQTGSIISSFL